MSRVVLAGMSGWGKSYMAQGLAERNSPEGGTQGDNEADHVLVLDYKDEFRGLVSQEYGPGLARHWIAGPKELEEFDAETYRAILEENGSLVLARHGKLSADDWQQVCAAAISGARRLEGNVVILIDEAHFVAPQSGKVPEPIIGLATTGRGEGAASIWVTQRPAMMEETVLAQADRKFLGGFTSDADLDKLDRVTEYARDLHKAGGVNVPGTVPEALEAADEGPISVRQFTDASGDLVGSEWLYSDNKGNMKRVDSSDYEMVCEHVGAQGYDVDLGV